MSFPLNNEKLHLHHTHKHTNTIFFLITLLLLLFLQNVTARVDINCHGVIPLRYTHPTSRSFFSLHAFILHPNQPGGNACVRLAHLWLLHGNRWAPEPNSHSTPTRTHTSLHKAKLRLYCGSITATAQHQNLHTWHSSHNAPKYHGSQWDKEQFNTKQVKEGGNDEPEARASLS